MRSNRQGHISLYESFLELLWKIYYLLWLKINLKVCKLLGNQKPKNLDNEIILITGSAGGIGREVCLNLARCCPRSTLVCWGTNIETNSALVSELRSLGVNARGYIIDITNRVKVIEIAARVIKEVGSPTVLINSAGIHHAAVPFLQLTPESIQKSFKVNYFSQLWILQAFLPSMIQNNHGHVVTIGSIASHVPFKCSSVYTGTKHALRGFIDCLRLELQSENSNIKFTDIYPGAVRTPFMNNFRINCRVPFLQSILPLAMDPKVVAEMIVDSFRRDKEYVVFITDLWLIRSLPNWIQVLIVKFTSALLGVNFSENATNYY